ncbi:MAG: 1-acyl-sn-glycerol-3-phosphate acyltransferase [Chitinophagaceae bacterium]|nr:1-acyl-sn-glycerol-3-phosphate acyltransferase [Chitinophagaceae bacterium]
MLYRILQIPARIAVHFYCKTLIINNRELLSKEGPLILAANHPNSFLDAVILASVFKKPIYSLARGDAFISPRINRLLESLNIMPVYRISEGAENLGSNYRTFDRVEELLEKNKIVLIFSEGLCVNEWHLRPLKKGTARLAVKAWNRDIPLEILPVGLNYSSFNNFGKSVHINFGDIITKEDLNGATSGKALNEFNRVLHDELSTLIYEIPDRSIAKRKKIFEKGDSSLRKTLLALPAGLGYLLNSPFYFLAKSITRKTRPDHYDSLLVGILFVFYPVYLMVIWLIVWLLTQSLWSLGVFAVLPLTALALLHYRATVR